MSQRPNGEASHRISGGIVRRLVAAGLLAEADRGDLVAVNAAFEKLMAAFIAVPQGRPLHGGFVTPANIVDALAHLMLGTLEMLAALDVLPPQAVATIFVHARAVAQAGHLPAGVHHLLGHYAEVLDRSLKRHMATVSPEL
jgi:hypothetical protein